MNTEPVAWGGALTGLVTAVVAVLNGFGIVHWTNEQVGLVLALTTALVGVVTVAVRSKVTPVASAQNPDTKV